VKVPTVDAHPLLLADRAALVGGLVWLERRWFEICGRWATDESDPAARVLFATHSRHHGERSGWLADRLPRAVGFDAEALSAAPDPDARSAVASAQSLTATAERLAALAVAVADLIDRVEGAAARCRPHSDGELVRTLGLISVDLDGHRAEIDASRG